MNATTAGQECIFCAIAARRAEASVVFEDDTVVAFMDLSALLDRDADVIKDAIALTG